MNKIEKRNIYCDTHVVPVITLRGEPGIKIEIKYMGEPIEVMVVSHTSNIDAYKMIENLSDSERRNLEVEKVFYVYTTNINGNAVEFGFLNDPTAFLERIEKIVNSFDLLSKDHDTYECIEIMFEGMKACGVNWYNIN